MEYKSHSDLFFCLFKKLNLSLYFLLKKFIIFLIDSSISDPTLKIAKLTELVIKSFNSHLDISS